jgi:hypothetical protein
MPRHSAEERAARFYHARKQSAAPPKGMTAPARRLWREIIESRAPDYFDAGSLQLLRLYCEAVAGANRLAAGLAGLEVGSAEAARAITGWKMMNASAIASAKALRLTVQNAVHTQSARITERGVVSNVDQRLLGGREAA